jgi:chemotaxis protein MotC
LRKAATEDFREPRNFRALLVYGMSGGNPATLHNAISQLQLDERDKALAAGVIAYLEGDPGAALNAFAHIELDALPEDIFTFVALVKGSLLAREAPEAALALLDQVRLLAPGTLVEEAALRRSIAITVTTTNADRFARASTQYVARFLHSPYASQFADTFVTGAVTLDGAIGRDRLVDIVSMMDAERERVIWLRIARSAAIDGLSDLSAFAAARAKADAGESGGTDDPRTLLYSGLSSIAGEPVKELAEKLGKIDRNRLSPGDRMLLDAARAVTTEVVAPPSGIFAPTPAQEPEAPAKAASKQIAEAVSAEDAEDLPLVEGIMPEPAQIDAAPAPLVAAKPALPEKPDETDETIANMRRTIDRIDQLLGSAPL